MLKATYGRTVAELDATGKYKTTFAYDAFGTLVSESYPNGVPFPTGFRLTAEQALHAK